MSDIDWSKAPEGFDYWIESYVGDSFRKLKNGKYYSIGGKWLLKGDSELKITKRPETVQPEWDGTGNPPVGTVCETRTHSGSWGYFKALAYCDGYVWCVNGHHENPTTYRLKNRTFRAVKTEKERAVEAMIEIVSGKEFIRDMLSSLYDAGYKLKGDK